MGASRVLPEPVAGSTHRLKYSLYYGRAGERLVGYDNERGKGDHRHYGDQQQERILSFESWEGLASVLTGERYRLLCHLHAHPAKSVNALAQSLRRQYRRVHEDVSVLERAGLIDRTGGGVRTTADKLSAVVML